MFLQKNGNGGSFASQRLKIYTVELWEMAALLLTLGVVSRLIDRRRLELRTGKWVLLLLTFLDLWILGRHRLLEVGPLGALAAQSSVLARLAIEPLGTRIANDSFKNLPMLVGAAPLLAYRTLDLPAVPDLTSLTRGPLSAPAIEPLVRAALRATGTGVRVFDPIENRKDHVLGRADPPRESVEDPALASWLFGSSWVTDQGPWARTFSFWHADGRPARAWLVPCSTISDPALLEDWSGGFREILAILDEAEPLESHVLSPGEWTIAVASDDPAWVIISQLADPQWKARWIGLDGQGEREGEILQAFSPESRPGGWQRVAVPASGRWTLRLEYEAVDVAEGAAISTIAWISWMMAAGFMAFQAWRGRSVPGSERDLTR
jgi:hypothetical protein